LDHPDISPLPEEIRRERVPEAVRDAVRDLRRFAPGMGEGFDDPTGKRPADTLALLLPRHAALLIGGEPTLVPDRIMAFVEGMEYITISTNGFRPLPRDGFERVSVAITLFGGGPLDDQLRAIKPNWGTFTGLFDTALGHYRDDPRAMFVYAITSRGVEHIEPTVRRIRDNGNRVTFNYYSEYHTDDPLRGADEQRLLDEALRVGDAYPDTVLSHPYYLRALISGQNEFGRFGYNVCPSMSWDHPAHATRRANGPRWTLQSRPNVDGAKPAIEAGAQASVL